MSLQDVAWKRARQLRKAADLLEANGPEAPNPKALFSSAEIAIVGVGVDGLQLTQLVRINMVAGELYQSKDIPIVGYAAIRVVGKSV